MLKKIFKKKKKNQENINNFKKVKKNTLLKVLISTLLLIIIAESSYYVYIYYTKTQEINSLKEENKIQKDKIQITLKNRDDFNKMTEDEKIYFYNKFANKSYLFGLKTENIDFIKKMTPKGSRETFYFMKIYFNTDSKNALIKYVALIYLDPNILKITKITKDNIEIISKEKL